MMTLLVSLECHPIISLLCVYDLVVSTSVIQEFFSFCDNPNGWTIKAATGRTVVVTFAGFTFGGILAKFEPIVSSTSELTALNTSYRNLTLTSIELSPANIYLTTFGGSIGAWLANAYNGEHFP
jgi:hypothetical protein